MGLFFPQCGTKYGRTGAGKLSFLGASTAHVLLLAAIALVVPSERLQELARPFTARVIELAPVVPKLPPQKPPPRKAPPAAQPIMVSNAPTQAAQAVAFTVAPQAPAPPAPVPITAVPGPAEPVVIAARFDADYLDNPKPVYPHASRRLGEQGKVLLRVRVSADGAPENVDVKHSSGFPRLDQAALDAVSRWRFVPARRGAEAVSAWVLVPITFNLNG